MRIGIDAYPLTRKYSTGIAVYLYNIINILQDIDSDNDYFLYAHDKFRLPFENRRWQVRIKSGLLSESSTVWLCLNAEQQLLKDKIDIFWGTQNLNPIFSGKQIKKVLTVHDLVIVDYPQTLPWYLRGFQKPLLAKSIIQADRIIPDSHFTESRIFRFFPNINKEKISVIHCGGAGSNFKPQDRVIAKKYITEKFAISGPYIFAVISFEPRKNIDGLLKAFNIFRNTFKIPAKLVIAGAERRSATRGIFKLYNNLAYKDEVRFVGHVCESDLVSLYCAAELFAFPSHYEGFGLPPLESMACGTPVLASDIPVFREVLGNAALFVDPVDPEKIAQGFYDILIDNSLADTLRRKGLEQVRLFSWENTARKVFDLFTGLEKNE